MFCAKHNRKLISLAGHQFCPACRAESDESRIKAFNNYEVECERRRLSNAIKMANIPYAFQQASFENFQPPSDRAAKLSVVMKSFAEKFKPGTHRDGFIFIGQPGTGKTHIACATLSLMISRGLSVRYESVSSLSIKARKMFGQDALRDLLDDLIRPSFLVLDEIDLHGPGDYDYQILFEIINGRYENMVPTLAISNRGIEDLTNDLNERMVSRILCANKPIHFDWSPMRHVNIRKPTSA